MSNPAVANAFPGIAEFLKLTSPNTHAASFRCPLFLFHARDDSNTPFAKSAAFAQLLEQSGNKPTFAEVPTGDHFDSMIQQGIPQGIAWLKALPSAPPTAPPSTPPSGEANNPPPENSSK